METAVAFMVHWSFGADIIVKGMNPSTVAAAAVSVSYDGGLGWSS